MDGPGTRLSSSNRTGSRVLYRWATVAAARVASTCIRWQSGKLQKPPTPPQRPPTTVRPTTCRATSTWPSKPSRPPGCRPRRPARWPLRRPADGAAAEAVVRGGARDGKLARRPRTTAASCCTRPRSATRRNRHRLPADGDGVGASTTAGVAPRAFLDADDGGDGPVAVAAVDVVAGAAAAVADDGGGDDVGGNRRRPPRADDRTPSTNQPRWPVVVRPRIRHRCTAPA